MRLGIGGTILMMLLVGVPVSSYWVVFRPLNAEIKEAQDEISHRERLLAKLREETSRNQDLEKANSDIGESIAAIEARLPTSKELDSVVRQVSDLAIQSGLPAPAMKSIKPVRAAMYMEQPMEMEMAGNFRAFYDFLIRVEQLPRITRVPDMKLKRADDADGSTKTVFTLSIYFQENRQDQAAGDKS